MPTSASAAHPLHSMHPIPAVRQPAGDYGAGGPRRPDTALPGRQPGLLACQVPDDAHAFAARAEVRQLLREKQLFPVEVAEVEQRERVARRQLSLRRGVSGLDLALLTRQLATLVRAGLPLEEALLAVSEQAGKEYNPLFIHGNCGLGKTHLLQALCRRFIELHPTKRWMYLTGEEFTNEFLTALRTNKLDAFRRKMRDLDLLVIDDVHFLGGKKATQEEFLHTFNAIEAMGRQVVMASDNHPKLIEEFGESLINRFVSGMVVRIDPPNFATRCEILRALARRNAVSLPEEVVCWIARRPSSPTSWRWTRWRRPPCVT